MRLLNKRQVWN